MTVPTATVIFSTYNQPDWLENTLRGFAAQDRRDFEVIVADDGSRDDTRERVERLRPLLPFALLHVWQPDDGFRKCRILNRAIVASRGDYLIFTDGDCVPRRDFVSQHLRLRQRDRFLSGGYVKLPMPLSRAIGHAEIASNVCFDLAWLRAGGLPRAPRDIKLISGGATARLFDTVIRTRASWNGHNASAWKSDLLHVNGFDERMGYGGEDRELGERLVNAGVRGKRIRHRAIVLHLDHPRDYRNDAAIQRNLDIRRQTRERKAVWTPYGIVP